VSDFHEIRYKRSLQKRLRNREFRKNRHSESHTLLKGINNFPTFPHLGKIRYNKYPSNAVDLVKIGVMKPYLLKCVVKFRLRSRSFDIVHRKRSVKAILYNCVNEFLFVLPTLSDIEIGLIYQHMLYSNSEFRETWCREYRILIIRVNKITFIRSPCTRQQF
jgi:hypothetical protein